MTSFTKFTEKPLAVEAVFWDGTVENAGPILKQFPGSYLTVDGDKNGPTIHLGRDSSSGPSYIYGEKFTYYIASADAFLSRFEEAPDASNAA